MGKVYAVLLAGTIRPSPLREALDIPVLALPVGETGTLLDAWHEAFTDLDPAIDLRVVVNSERDLEFVAAAAESRRMTSPSTGTIGINGAQWFHPDTPFGGYRQSGLGRENGQQGFEEYLETKIIALPAKR